MKFHAWIAIAVLALSVPHYAAAASLKTRAQWEQQVRAIALKKLPRPVRRKPGQWIAVVQFIVMRDGRVRASSLHRSSGFAPVDAAARKMLDRTSLLPPFAADMKEAETTLTMPVRYGFPG